MYNNEYLLSYLVNYLFFYNLNILILISIVIFFNYNLNFLNNLITLNYSNWVKLCILMIFFSLAGIPPFLLFFYKLNLIYYVSLINFKIFLIFYILLFISIIFYISNIRYLMWFNNTKLTIYSILLVTNSYLLLTACSFVLSFNMVGLFFMDDFILLFIFIVISF